MKRQKLHAAQARKGLVSFDKFKVAVDLVLIKSCCMTSICLPDWHWKDAFDVGLSAGDAVDNFLDEIELY